MWGAETGAADVTEAMGCSITVLAACLFLSLTGQCLFDPIIPGQARCNSSRPDATLVSPCPPNPNRRPTFPLHWVLCSMRGKEGV
eukprot:1143630-Pelagomonas_calceolata.AAC.2